MRDYSLFRYDGNFYGCSALASGWGRGALWFTNLLRPMVQHLREKKECRVLPYIDDLAAAPSPHGTVAMEEDCTAAGKYLKGLFLRLGIVIHGTKGRWPGSRALEHLGMVIGTEQMHVFVSDRKVKEVQALAKKLLLLAQRNARVVPSELLRHFCGFCVSLTLAVPLAPRLARLHTRSLYYVDMGLAEKRRWRRQKDKKETCGRKKIGWRC